MEKVTKETEDLDMAGNSILNNVTLHFLIKDTCIIRFHGCNSASIE